MATKKLEICSPINYPCKWIAGNTVILCLQDTSLINQEDVCNESKNWIDGTICQAFQYSDCDLVWHYVIQYDDTQLADPDTALLPGDVSGIVCRDCLTSYIDQRVGEEITASIEDDVLTITSQHGCVYEIPIEDGTLCVEDTDSLDLSVNEDTGCLSGDVNISGDADNALEIRADGLYVLENTEPCVDDTDSLDLSVNEDTGCISGDVNISADPGNTLEIRDDGLYGAGGGGPGDAWLLLGNAGTDYLTNFAGTTDDEPFVIRVNNQRAGWFIPSGTGIDSAQTPDVVLCSFENDIGATSRGNGNFIAGGYLGSPNVIQDDGSSASYCCVIGGGDTHIIDTCFNVGILSGTSNEVYYGFGDVICGGYGNIIDGTNGNTNQNCIVAGNFNFISLTNEGGLTGESIIGSGSSNWIEDGDASGILSGLVNELHATSFCTIASGQYNSISGTGLGFEDTDIAQACFIGGGGHINNFLQGNKITGSTTGMGAPQYDAILGGQWCEILNGCRYSSILGGQRSKVDNTWYAFVLGGSDNIIETVGDNAQYSWIGNGNGNTITDANRSAILSGSDNVLENCVGSTIINGRGVYLGESSLAFSSIDAYVSGLIDLRAFNEIAYFGDVDTWIGNTDGTARKLKLIEPNTDLDFSSANYTSFEAQAQSANIEYKLPAAIGSTNQVLSISGVAGTVATLTWATPSGGSAITTKTSDYTVTSNDDTILANANGGGLTISLPSAATVSAKKFTIKKIDATANVVIVDPNSTQTIDGSLTFNIATQYQSVTVQSDGSNWYIL